ncbi:nucleoporin Nup37 [Onthophagus taurus]|uniref:nucleoporin Nup37 n=1 Tax=Onthophagus taurus TaxID=166361 RepID=UPI000C206212|nr:nucleoporin Nup37 [Onthophagus taurus]
MDFEAIHKQFTEPVYSIDLQENSPVLAVHYSTYEWSQDIILLAFPKKIIVGQILFEDKLELSILAEIQHPLRCTNLYLSSETVLNIIPINVQFCTAANDFKIRIFKTNLSDENSCMELTGHESYINDLNYDPTNSYIASVSDDHTVKVWSTEDNKLTAFFNLTSPGVSCCWHREDPLKLLVAEKIGVIRFYNVSAIKPILSCSYTKSLSAAHWSPNDSQLLASLHMGELLLWDATRLSRPIQTKLIYTESGGDLKFNMSGEFLAIVNKLENSIKVFHVQTQQERLNATLSSPTNITWHFRYPLICVGDDRKLNFWKIPGK